MIQTNELRLGNLVQSKTGKNYYSIAGISPIDFTLSNEKTGLFSSHGCHVYGIPLSEEILLKCGIIKSDENINEYILEIDNGWKVIYQKLGYIYFQFQGIECEISHVKYEYLHQLQNLYFALTGEELEIKL